MAAPFLHLHASTSSSSSSSGEALSFVLFEAFVFRFLLHFYCREASSSGYLFKAFRLFHLLLLHFDPQLALHLFENQFIPELYAPQWFLCVYARGLPLPLVLRLWDMLLAMDDPAFTFFIGLALLRSRREDLLQADDANMPEVIGDMRIGHDEASVDKVLQAAVELYQQAPRCFLRYLRICCVDTPELAPSPPPKIFVLKGGKLCPDLTTLACTSSPALSPSHRLVEGSTHFNRAYALDAPGRSLTTGTDWEAYFVEMARQSVRRCVLLQASELVSALCPIVSSNGGNSPRSSAVEDVPKPRQQHYVLIDIRSLEEVAASGGGDMPTSIRVDPTFLGASSDQTVMLGRWLDHFDSLRGLPLCIVDMPPAHASGGALWRRLLLGQVMEMY